MRKFTLFLALSMIALALPDKAKAWTFGTGSNPWKLELIFEAPYTLGTTTMNYDNNNGIWNSVIFTAQGSDLKFKIRPFYITGENDCFTIGNSSYTAYPNPNGGVGEWANATANGNDNPYNVSGLTDGTRYRIDITGDGSNDNDVLKYRVVEITEEKLYLYTFGSGQNVVSIAEATNNNGIFTFNLDLNEGTYLFLSRNAGATTLGEMEADYGRFNPANDVTINLPETNTSFVRNTNGGAWKATQTGRYTITVDWRNRKLTAVNDLYIYSSSDNWSAQKGHVTPTTDGKYIFTFDLNAGEYIKLSEKDAAQFSVGGSNWTPATDTDIEAGKGTSFGYNPSGAWKATHSGRYTVTVDWPSKTLTAVNDLYVYSSSDNWSAQKGHVTPTTDGKYIFTFDLNAGEYIKLSEKDAAQFSVGGSNWTPATDTDIEAGKGTSFGYNPSGAWKATHSGRYTVTVDWPSKTLTAVNELYIYSSNDSWTAMKGQASPTKYGKYTYTIDLNAGENIVVSENGNNFNVGNYNWRPSSDTEIVSNETTNCEYGTSGAWKAPRTGKYAITVDWNNKPHTFHAIEVSVHMPLKSTDFADNKKHYFLVGERNGEWHLQPEWEFKEVNGTLVLNNRYIYNGAFAVGVVDNYDDYIHHTFTYYCKSQDFTTSATSSTGDISGTGRVYRQGKGKTRFNPSDVFYAKFDGEDSYFTGRGTFMSEIKVSLNGDKLPTGITFTKGSTEEATRQRVFTLVGNNIINRNFSNTSGTGQTTMHNRGYDGWFDSWIQYDPATNKPYVDGNGEYLYHTSFTPDYLTANPVQFNLGLNDGSEFAYTSGQVQLVEWKNLPNLDSDPYKSYYEEAFGGNTTISDSGKLTAGNGYNFKLHVECTPDDADNRTTTLADGWNCYVVRDMWIGGDIKFWSGWGGNEDATNGGYDHLAVWHGPNGGPDINEGGKYQVKGFDINAGGLDAVLYKNVARRGSTDYRISEDGKPAYFNRVILWFNNTAGVNNSYIQFIQESAGPAIFAQTVQNGDKKNHIRYDWYLNKTQKETGSDAKVVSYEIIRYRIVDGKPQFTGYPQGQKVDIKDKNLTVGMLYEGEAGKHLDVTRFLDKGILDDNGFAPGLYEYEIYVTDEHGGRKKAVSNRVAIYEDETVTPNIVPMQLVELRDGYEDKFGTRHDSAAKVLKDAGAPESTVAGKKYMTYRVNDSDKFYIMENIVDGSGKNIPVGVEIIDSKIAREFLNNNPDKYWWTSNYYVRCLDYNRYESILQGYKDNGTITDESIPVPTLKIKETIKSDAGKTIAELDHGTASEFKFGGQTYYSAIVKRGGNLADAIFDVTLNYTYHPVAGGEQPVTTRSAAGIDPVTPRPFWPLYRYVYDRKTNDLGTDYKWGKIKVPVNNWNGHASTGDAILAGDMAEVYVRLDDGKLDTRNFTLQVDFYRPNVDKEIYSYYDIKYYVNMTNTDTEIDKTIQVPLKVEAVLHDVDRADNHNLTPNRYRMEFKGMHPRNDVYPTVDFIKTEYVPNDQAGTQYKPQTGNFGKMLTIKAERTMQATNNDGITNAHLGYIKREDGKLDWMYKGHEDFKDNDPTLEKHDNNEYEDPSTYDPNSENYTPIKPVYYLIELNNGMGDCATYPYLVPHVEGHHTGDKFDTDKYGLITNDTDPLIGTYIAQDFINETTPKIYATAIYIFERPITGATSTDFDDLEIVSLKVNDNETVTTKAANAPASVPNKITDKEFALNGAGNMPNYWEAPDGNVLDLSKADETTGYNGYIAVKGATYMDKNDAIVTGVEDVLADMENGDAVYYNLQGVRIDKPTATGVYLRVQGNRTTKIVVK